MKIIIAVGLRGEMLFNNRRVSRDEYIIDDMMALTGGKLTAKQYSAKLFLRYPEVRISDAAVSSLKESEWCFIEDESLGQLLPLATSLVVYNFGRTYPSELKFDTVPTEIGFIEISRKKFAGHSHDEITRTVYERATSNSKDNSK